MIELETEQLRKADSEINSENSYSQSKETLPSLPTMLDEVTGYAAPLRWYTEMGG